MAKQKSKSTKKTTSNNRHSNAGDAQKKLVALEEKLVGLLQQHAQLTKRSASEDSAAAARVLGRLRDPSHVKQLLTQKKGLLGEVCAVAIFRELASGIECQLSKIKAAFLGPLHSYSHLATLKKFGQSADMVAVRTIAAVFEAVSSGQVDAGLVPIENSTDGRIVDTLDRLATASVKICGEVPLRIHHNLLGIGTRADVREVCSKPQAISQCRVWLANHLPEAKVVSMSSTAAAAERAAKDKSVAAIASYQAGVQYGLKVLAENIEDNQHNVTRFAVIGKHSAERTGDDKTSLMFELAHEPGALADAMVIFKRNRLNLTWIESFPKPGKPSEYLFFVELLGHETDLRVRRALAALEKKTVRVELLGSFAQSKIL